MVGRERIKRPKSKRGNRDLAVVNNCSNDKIGGKKYKYMHSMDCVIYVTLCENCKKEVGGWTPDEADTKWEEHCC